MTMLPTYLRVRGSCIPRSQVAALVQLLALRAARRFLNVEDRPAAAVEYVAHEIKVEFKAPIRLTQSKYSERTWYRHQDAILAYLNVNPWNDEARALTESTMMKMVEARTDPADLIDAAVDALVRQRFELSALIAPPHRRHRPTRHQRGSVEPSVCGSERGKARTA